VFEGDQEFSLAYLPQEYPAYGKTDFRHPAYQVRIEDGNTITDLEYVNHTISKGKPKLEGLPATYVEHEDEASTLEVRLRDSYLDLDVSLTYSVYEHFNVITRNVRFENHGKQCLSLLRALSMSLDFPDADFEMLQLSGHWARERHIKTRPLVQGIQSIESTRGASSAFQNPFVALLRKDASEDHGEVYGFSLVYSGNFLAEIEVNEYETTRVSMGINPFDFEWLLEPGEQFQTPEVVMVYSENGLNSMSQTYHTLYRTRLARGPWRNKERPVLMNSWEATFFDVTEQKILSLAREAKTLGIELVVLDDGWFGHRDDDASSLGDWFEHPKKFPNGLRYLGEEINTLGLQFGLWFEPEMISKDSDLYRVHPDWLLYVPNRRLSPGRNQFVLDFSRQEVREAIYDMMETILENAPISYVKWDMNRNMTEIGSATLPPKRQKEVAHRYILGLYELLERLTARFPDVLFESCAGGGGRFDPGMLFYMPQTWTSDNTDAIERLKIQYGTSLVYPLSSMGAHVSAVPNHQVGRITPLKTRADVAFFGVFGYELDIEALPQEEKEAIKDQIAFYKAHRRLFQFGTFYRLASPFEKNAACWMVVSEDQKEALVGYYKVMALPNPRFFKVRLQGLLPDVQYEIQGIGKVLYGDAFMSFGLQLPIESKDHDFLSHLWKLQAMD
jgi:alpha-galactosidase